MKYGITQMQLAEKLGVTRTAITKWETGDSYPRAEMLPQIAKHLGCTIDDLYAETEVKEAV